MPEGALRIDKFLWFVRLAPSRGAAAALAEAGHVRLDGRRVDRAHACVRVGSVLSLPHGTGARVVRVYVKQLRSKLGDELIGTVPGGYVLGL